MYKNCTIFYLEQKPIQPRVQSTNRHNLCTKVTCCTAILFLVLWSFIVISQTTSSANHNVKRIKFDAFFGLLNQALDQCIQLDIVILQTQICAWAMFYWFWKKPVLNHFGNSRLIQIHVCVRFPILLSICFMISSITASPVPRPIDSANGSDATSGTNKPTNATTVRTSHVASRPHKANHASIGNTSAGNNGGDNSKVQRNGTTSVKMGTSTITVSLPESYRHMGIGNFSIYGSNHYSSNNRNINVPITQNQPRYISSQNPRYLFSNPQTQTSTEDLHFRSGSHLATLVLRDNARSEVDVYRTHVWFRRMKNYSRPNPTQAQKWTRIDIKNCHNSLEPPDLLTPEEVSIYEQSLDQIQIYRKRSLRRQRNGMFPIISRYPYSSHTSHQPIRSRRTTTQTFLDPRSQLEMVSSYSTPSMYSSSLDNSDSTSSSSLNTLLPTMEHVETSEVNSKPLTTVTLSNQSTTVITVHDIAIRPSILVLRQGNINARLRYIIQLHKELKEQYRLILEARINPEYPPLYIGVIQNVCSHWPANIPRSKCSTKKPRFYQKDTICFCHMPPGVYRQRLRVNLNNVLDGLELPRFLVNVLFHGKKLNIYITVKLESENKNIVGCAEMKLPLQFVSA